jgi:hypothetical protein
MQEGLANDGQPFTNFTAQENQGKICFNSTDFTQQETELPEV